MHDATYDVCSLRVRGGDISDDILHRFDELVKVNDYDPFGLPLMQFAHTAHCRGSAEHTLRDVKVQRNRQPVSGGELLKRGGVFWSVSDVEFIDTDLRIMFEERG